MKFDQSFPYDLYQFIIKPLRDADTTGTLERYVMASQEGFEQIQDNIKSVDHLRDANLVPDDYLGIQTWLLGWTPELGYIKSHLTDSELRRLLTLSVPMWKDKTSADGIIDTLRLFTGQDALMWDWFAFRPVVGTPDDRTLSVGYTRLPGDFWVIGGDGDALYDDSRDMSYIWLADDAVFSKQLAHDLLQLNRPTEEAFIMCCPELVDDFHQGLASFDLKVGSSPVYNATAKNVKIGKGTMCQLNVDSSSWKSYSYSLVARWISSANNATLLMKGNAQLSGTSSTDHYELQVSPAGVVTLVKMASGVGTVIATGSMPWRPTDAPLARVVIELRVGWDDVNTQTVQAVIDGDVVLDTSVSYGAHLDPGSLLIEVTSPSAGDSIQIDNLIAYSQTQQTTTFVSRGVTHSPFQNMASTALESYPVSSATTDFKLDTTTMVAAMAPRPPSSEGAQSVLWSEDFSGGTLGSFTSGFGAFTDLWHAGTHRNLKGAYAAGYATGDGAGHSGAHGNIPWVSSQGALTSPVISLPAAWVGFDTSKYQLKLQFGYCWSKQASSAAGTAGQVNTFTRFQIKDSTGAWVDATQLFLYDDTVNNGNDWTNPQGGIIRLNLNNVATSDPAIKVATETSNSGTLQFRVFIRHINTAGWNGGLWVDDFKLIIEEI